MGESGSFEGRGKIIKMMSQVRSGKRVGVFDRCRACPSTWAKKNISLCKTCQDFPGIDKIRRYRREGDKI